MSRIPVASGGMAAALTVRSASSEPSCDLQVKSDEAGAGFAEVGALSDAKDALREAVQLPLQHPRLFQKGSLAR